MRCAEEHRLPPDVRRVVGWLKAMKGGNQAGERQHVGQHQDCHCEKVIQNVAADEGLRLAFASEQGTSSAKETRKGLSTMQSNSLVRRHTACKEKRPMEVGAEPLVPPAEAEAATDAMEAHEQRFALFVHAWAVY